jgi:cyclophilin family peptidyl-prolyl cis-trans isomerase
MKVFKTIFYFFSVVLLLSSCVPPTQEKLLTEVNINFDDAQVRQIYDLRTAGKYDSLYIFLKHKDPTYRYLAATILGSVLSPGVSDSLLFLLKDPVPNVRTAAAFSIGQQKNESSGDALVSSFVQDDSTRVFEKFNATLLEAIGKCANKKYLPLLASVESYGPKDTALLLGQAKAIYQFGLRKLIDSAGTQRMHFLASNSKFPESIRLMATHYFYRSEGWILDSTQIAELNLIFRRELNPNIRIALAQGLGKTNQNFIINSFFSHWDVEIDHRVKINMLRSLKGLPYSKIQPFIIKGLEDKNIFVQRSAAEFAYSNGNSADAGFYYLKGKDSLTADQFSKAKLLAAANKFTSWFYPDLKNKINWRLEEGYKNSSNPYHKAAYLDAMAESGWNYKVIQNLTANETNPVILGAAGTALTKIAESPIFYKTFGESSRRVQRELCNYFLNSVQSLNPARIATASPAIRNPQLNYKLLADSSLPVLKKSLSSLKLPKDIEAYRELNKSIAFLEGKTEPKDTVLTKLKKIDWSLLKGFTGIPKCVLSTSRGNIIIKLQPENAPAAVSNFIHLIRSGFFNDKNFHRVVPAFVIQGGSPTNDEYGGMDFSIPSEFSTLSYSSDGILGMASAGPDTESSQFFITTAPALHLDGRYTIFGKVVDGSQVLQLIDIGDKIIKASLMN